MNIRKFKETDRDFITRSVLFSFMNGSKEVQRINRDSYMQGHNVIINRLLDRCHCALICDPTDEDLIYGFIIFENLPNSDVVHYLYVRKAFRGKAISRHLLGCAQKKRNLALSHLTEEFKPARLKKIWEKVIYDPYLRSHK